MKRRKTDNKLFLEFCKKGATDQEIMEGMGWKRRTKNSKADPTKRVRAYRWTAINKGLMVDGKKVFLKGKQAKKKKAARKKSHSSAPSLRKQPGAVPARQNGLTSKQEKPAEIPAQMTS
jgi:hypothetical protein